MQVRTYIRPASLADALHTLATVEEPIAIIAGGTDVLVYAREDDRYANSALIDIYGLAEELGQIREEGDDLIIGALATHAAISQSPLALRYAPILAVPSPRPRSAITPPLPVTLPTLPRQRIPWAPWRCSGPRLGSRARRASGSWPWTRSSPGPIGTTWGPGT